MTEIENIAAFIEEKALQRGWENAKYMAINEFGEEKVLQAMEYIHIGLSEALKADTIIIVDGDSKILKNRFGINK